VETLKTLLRVTGVELLKLRNKPVSWAAALILCGLPVLGEFLLVKLSPRQAVWPNCGFVFFGGDMLLFVALISVLVAVMALGNDYELRTVRGFLCRGVKRSYFILSKIIASLVTTLINGLAYIFMALLATTVGHFSLSSIPLPEAAGENLVWRALGAVGVILLVELVCSGVVMLALVAGRNAWAGILGGLGFFFIEYFLGGMGPAELLGVQDIYRYTITYRALGLLARLFPSDPKLGLLRSWAASDFVEPGPAVAFMLIFGCGLTLLAILVFQQQDLMEQR
jgi:ABC-type transport system involved in multi-copper enzyme maturation permease subunit